MNLCATNLQEPLPGTPVNGGEEGATYGRDPKRARGLPGPCGSRYRGRPQDWQTTQTLTSRAATVLSWV